MIPVNALQPHLAPLHAELMSALAAVVQRGPLVLGPAVEAFEAAFAAYCGASHGIGVANGTDALELALRAVGVGAGSRVVLAANAGLYGTTATLACGALPVYADVLPGEATLDPASVDAAMRATAGVQAVVVTHLYGRVAHLDALVAIARRHGAAVVEDCAQAHGATLADGRPAGSVGDAAAFSFYPTKNLGALGDAGMVLCQRDDLATTLRRLRQYGWDAKYHALQAGGRNSRLDALQAAALSVMLPHLAAWNARRRAIAAAYDAGLRNPRIAPPPPLAPGDVAHLYVVRSDDRDALRAHLHAHGVASDVHYPVPDHRQPHVAGLGPHAALPHTEADARRVLSLPLFPELGDDDVARVLDACNTF